jgi:transmembrane sensor
MSQEKFWILLSKKLSGEATDSEIVELQQFIQKNAEWQLAVQNLEDLWKHRAKNDDYMQGEDAYMLHLHRIKELNIPFGETLIETPVVSIRKKRKWYWAVAAVIAVSAGLFGFLKNSGSKVETEVTADQVNEVSTRPGSKSKIHLPDGSTVWLNADSKLEYDKNFNGEMREVQLTGEAFFDVVKNAKKPFIVHTGSANIKVLGTSFNVKSYLGDKTTETSLIRGSVEVTLKKRPGEKWMLKPNEKLVILNEYIQPERNTRQPINKIESRPFIAIRQLTYQNGDTIALEAAWTKNKLSFEDESFLEAAQKMERWYDVNFVFKNKIHEELMLHATFTTETIYQAMEALQYSFKFKYEIKDNEVTIY